MESHRQSTGQQRRVQGPQSANMAAPVADAGEFEKWLNDRLDSLEIDGEVYGAYLLGVLQEVECEEEKLETLQGILSAFLVNPYISMSTTATSKLQYSYFILYSGLLSVLVIY